MALGDNRVPIKGPRGIIYWYNPSTGRVFIKRRDRRPIQNATVTKAGKLRLPDDFSVSGPKADIEWPGHWESEVGTVGEAEAIGAAPVDEIPDVGQIPPKPTARLPEGYEYVWDEDFEEWMVEPVDAFETATGRSIFAAIQQYLKDWGLEGLTGWVEEMIRGGAPQSRIMLELREQDAYKRAFPEMELRKENGFSPMLEAEIRDWRNNAKQLAKSIWGVDISQDAISRAIGNGWSVSEWEHRLLVTKKASENRWVKQVLEHMTGRRLSETEFIGFFDPEMDTAEFDEAVEKAMFMGLPAAFRGLGVRTEKEAARLKELGFTPEQAQEQWGRLANSLPSVDRLAAIDAAIRDDDKNPYDSLGTLFETIFAQDPSKQLEIAQMFAREGARFSRQGGVASAGGRAVGLLTPDERAGL